MEYEVQWGEGPLGVTLRPDLGEDLPPVVGRITRLDSAAALAKVQVGDMLVSINGVDTARQGYDHVVDMLQRIPRPAMLRFRVPRQLAPPQSLAQTLPINRSGSSMRDRERSTAASRVSTGSADSSASGRTSVRTRGEQYTVVWTEGPLGMILRPDDDDVHVPCIRKITGKGAGTGMDRATVGDVLVAVNGQETKTMGFRSTISLLKTIRKPAILKFKRMHRRPRPSRPHNEPSPVRNAGAYDIVWREGDLGLKLKAGPRDVPFLSKLTGKGTATGLKNACIGDELVSVNGVPVEGNAYHDTLRMLKHSQKPAVLRFRPTRERRMPTMPPTPDLSSRELGRAHSRHIPQYDNGQTRLDGNGERKKKKSRIPLEIAKQLVAAARGLDPQVATLGGVPIADIQDGTREAHLLRVEAKTALTSKTDKPKNGVAPKEALLQAEKEARVLAEALEKVKSQAMKYEKLLEEQKKQAVVASAVRSMAPEIVKRNDNVLAQLAKVVADRKRDYEEEEIVVPPMISDEEVEALTKLQQEVANVANIQVVVPALKVCADCGASEKESKLDLDDDGQYYCKDCWDRFLGEPAKDTVALALPDDAVDPVPSETISPPPAPVEMATPAVVADTPSDTSHAASPVSTAPVPRPTSAPTPAIKRAETAALPSAIDPLPTNPPIQRAETLSSPFSRLSQQEREEEEENARVEAKRKLIELKTLGRNGSRRGIDTSSVAPVAPVVDRSARVRQGTEELAQALEEEEERARADGDLALAKRLHAQRVRIMGPQGLTSTASSRFHLNGNGASPNGVKDGDGASTIGSVSSSPDLRKVPSFESEFTAPPVDLKRAVTMEPPSSTFSTASTVAESESGLSKASLSPVTVVTDYDETDDESEDQIEMGDSEEDALREIEEKNFALARQLDQAHNLFDRVRESMMLSDEDADELMGGLSSDQINLFKKLTTQAQERESTVDRLHPDVDSDSSDSDQEEEEGEEDDEGVWI